jgi:hypothetical protein
MFLLKKTLPFPAARLFSGFGISTGNGYRQ